MEITYKEVAAELQISESAVIKHFANLREHGVLKREGGTRGHWELISPEQG